MNVFILIVRGKAGTSPSIENDFGLFYIHIQKTSQEFVSRVNRPIDDLIKMIEDKTPQIQFQLAHSILVDVKNTGTEKDFAEQIGKFSDKIQQLNLIDEDLNRIKLWQLAHRGALLTALNEVFCKGKNSM